MKKTEVDLSSELLCFFDDFAEVSSRPQRRTWPKRWQGRYGDFRSPRCKGAERRKGNPRNSWNPWETGSVKSTWWFLKEAITGYSFPCHLNCEWKPDSKISLCFCRSVWLENKWNYLTYKFCTDNEVIPKGIGEFSFKILSFAGAYVLINYGSKRKILLTISRGVYWENKISFSARAYNMCA